MKLIIIFSVSVMFEATLYAQAFSGIYNLDNGYTIPQEISFTVADDGLVNLSFSSDCLTQDALHIKFETSWGSALIPYGSDTWGEPASTITQPYGPFPLKAGEYKVVLVCKQDNFTDLPVPGYSLTVSETATATTFDSEPDGLRTDPIYLDTSKSYEGSIGYGGYVALKEYNDGFDKQDNYYFTLPIDAKYKVQIEHDDTFNGTWGDDAMGLYLNRGSLWETLHVVPNTTSFITPEYNADGGRQCLADPEDECPMSISVVANSYDGDGYPAPENAGYGGYKLTIIINDEPVLEPELKVTVLEATWRKKDDFGRPVNPYLKVQYEVDNSYDEAKTVGHDVNLFTPTGTWNEPEVKEKDRLTLISEMNSQDCNYGKIDWSNFCTKISYNRLRETCNYNSFGTGEYVTAISAKTKKTYTASLPVTSLQYQGFDDSVQILEVDIWNVLGDDSSCYTHGVSFWAAWAVFLPTINSLLFE